MGITVAAQALPKAMRSLVAIQSQRSLALEASAPLPIPGPDEHLIRVQAVALTAGELDWPRPAEFNQSVPGVDMAGVVVRAPLSSKFQPGAAVYMRTTFPRPGSAREYTIGLESELALSPKNITPTEAAAVPVSALTSWQAFFIQAGLRGPGSSSQKQQSPRILINGASGSVGMWATQLAKAAGFHVVGTSSPANISLVRSNGADEVIDYKSTPLPTWVKQNPDRRVDLLFDTVGGKSLDSAWHTVRPGGRVISVAPPEDMVYKFILDRPEGVDESIDGKFFIMHSDGAQLAEVTELIEAGKAKPVVDSVFSLEEFEKAFERVGSGKAVGKVVINVAD